MLKTLVTTLFLCSVINLAQVNVQLKSHFNPHPADGYNDIWGYVDPSGNEYALLGVQTGTSIVSLIDPSNPVEVAFIPGPNSIWRDIKVHSHYAYVITEGMGNGQGLQIINLSQLPNSASLVNTIDTWFSRAHNIFIDNGFAYVIGTNGGGGMHILDLSDPVNPVRTAYYSESNYIHDVYVWNDTVVAAAENSYDLIDVTNKANPVLISSSDPNLTPGIYAHSGWMTEDKRYFIGTEEFNQIDITVWDLQDRTSWELVVPSWQTSSNATVHNLFIKGNYAHISYYSDGYVVLDISNPLSPIMVGYYDTPSAWGCYPYLPSGLVLISDIPTGLYVLEFDETSLSPVISHTPMQYVLNENPVTLSAQIVDDGTIAESRLYYRTVFNGNTSNWINLLPSAIPGNNVYQFTVPGQSHLTKVEYYFAAIDNQTNLTTLPAGGSGINPPGSTPPQNLLSYQVINAGQVVVNYFSPEGDTTIPRDGLVNFIINAEDTSGLSLTYQWRRNSTNSGNGSQYQYVSLPFLPAPRTDTVSVFISNGFNSFSRTWLIHVENVLSVEDETTGLSYKLYQNFPNPFNPSTEISFTLRDQSYTDLSVYNLLGEKVASLVSELLPSGRHSFRFDASGLPSGVYIADLRTENFTKQIKMTLLK